MNKEDIKNLFNGTCKLCHICDGRQEHNGFCAICHEAEQNRIKRELENLPIAPRITLAIPKTNDTKLKSISETIVNTSIGYAINFVANMAILPAFGLPFNWTTFNEIGLLYTAVSIARQYVLRRLFNRLHPSENLYTLLKRIAK